MADRSGFAELAMPLAPQLYGAALRMTRNAADAEDLVQDVCVRVLAKPRLVSGDDDLGYLLRVLRNTFISNRRTAIRRPATAVMFAATTGTVAPVPSAVVRSTSKREVTVDRPGTRKTSS